MLLDSHILIDYMFMLIYGDFIILLSYYMIIHILILSSYYIKEMARQSPTLQNKMEMATTSIVK